MKMCQVKTLTIHEQQNKATSKPGVSVPSSRLDSLFQIRMLSDTLAGVELVWFELV